MASFLVKKGKRLFCNKILREYEACKKWSESLKSLGSDCANKLYYSLLQKDKTSFTRKDNIDFIDSTGKSYQVVYQSVKFIMNSSPTKNLPKVEIRELCQNLVGCLVELKILKNKTYYKVFGLGENHTNDVEIAEKYLNASLLKGKVPKHEMFHTQWVREQHNNLEFIIRMRQLTAKMDDDFLKNLTTSDIEKLIAFWFVKLSKSVGDLQKSTLAQRTFRKSSLRLLLLTADEIASIFIANFFKSCTVTKNKSKNNIYKIECSSFCTEFGGKLCAEVNKSFKIPGMIAVLRRIFKEGYGLIDAKKFNKITSAKKIMDDIDEKYHIVWDEKNCHEIGKTVLDLFEKIAFLWTPKRQKSPAFTIITSVGKKNYFRKHVILFSREMVAYLYQGLEYVFNLRNDPLDNPMLVEPKEWTGPNEGGFMVARMPLVRMKTLRDSYGLIINSLPKNDLKPLLASVNALQKCAWTVNGKVFDVMKVFFEKGKNLSGLPGTFQSQTDPGGAGSIPTKSHFQTRNEFETLMLENMRRYNQSRNEQQSYYNYLGLYASCLLKIKTAEKFRNADFYFPYFLDFRGRCYPYSPHFNHNGDDLSRGLLKFAEKRPLKKTGWNWLLVHLANVTGRNKISNAERSQWARRNMANVLASARRPLETAWWRASEAPWQTLACCFEIEAAVSSKNEYTFLSNLPVYQDGSCNGLQHYSAMSLDPLSAEYVNLIPSDLPKDAYQKVLDISKQKITLNLHSADGEKRRMAEKILPIVNRKIVKQTVMTTVYGVTKYGASHQIEKQLRKVDLGGDNDFSIPKLSFYLADVVMSSVQELFAAAFRIMAWLRDSAKKISAADQPVGWLTPLSLPALQHYGLRPESFGKTFRNGVDARSQVLAFPPNFVHSLDSTHMLFTAKSCEEQNINFASVHDSYWTHACDVDQMSINLRRNFIRLHSVDQIQALHAQLSQAFPDIAFAPPPKRGALCLKEVANSQYFFS